MSHGKIFNEVKHLSKSDIDKETEQREKTKDIIAKIASFVMIVLIISFVLTNPVAKNFIISLFETSEIKEEIVEINSTSDLIFIDNTYKKLFSIYLSNEGREFKVCLMGEIIEGDYIITKILIPRMFFQSFTRVESIPCPDETLVDLHSHPYMSCIPSEQDLRNAESIKKRNPSTLLAILCTEKRFNFYG